MARNQFSGACRDCGQHVEAGAGYFHKQPRGSFPKWAVRCMTCVVAGKQARGDTLSFAQREHVLAAKAEAPTQDATR